MTELAYVLVSKLGMNDVIGLRGFKIEEYIKNMSQETLKVLENTSYDIEGMIGYR